MWFWIALVAPISHALTNHIDKHLIDKYLKGGEVGSLVLFSSILAVMALPVAYLFDPSVFSVAPVDALLLIFNGALIIIAYIFYFYALQERETSLVMPLAQLVPVFSFILGYTMFGETLTMIQIVGSLIIMAGSILLSLEFGDRVKPSYKMIFYMSLVCLFYAISGVLFKFVAVSEDRFWQAAFWDFVGKALVGLLIFAFVASYRRSFIQVLKSNSIPLLSWNVVNEILATIGELALLYAVLLAPVAMVQVVAGSQPIFVFLLGVIFTLLWPSFVSEDLSRHSLIQKIAGTAVVVAGTVLINL